MLSTSTALEKLLHGIWARGQGSHRNKPCRFTDQVHSHIQGNEGPGIDIMVDETE